MKVGILGAPDGVAEGRVLVTPRQVGTLEQNGATVLVEHGAGLRCGVDDADYAAEGGLVHHRAEVLAQSELVLTAARPSAADVARMAPGAILMGFLHVEVGGEELVQAASLRGVRLVALERARTADGRYPFRERMAEVAGIVCVQLTARLLESGPGNGVLLGGVAGLAPTHVVVIGAGCLGRAATRAFSGAGASVTLLDRDLSALEAVERENLRRVQTVLAGPAEIADAAETADVLVAAVRSPSGAPPKLLSPYNGKPGAVWLDLSIDEGGCIEGSRPVYSAEQAYEIEGVRLCPVPNLASWAARSASRIASALLFPALQRASEQGVFTLEDEPWLAAGEAR